MTTMGVWMVALAGLGVGTGPGSDALLSKQNTIDWPVHIVDSDSHPAGRSPVMVVGTLFTGGHCYREDDGNRVHVTPADQIVMPARSVGNKYSKAMNEYLLGNVRSRPSCDEEETCVFLTSPPLNNGWEFTVDSVQREDKLWTVRVSYWYDNIKHQWSPGPNRSGQMLRLGWLPPGEYTCRIIVNHRVMDTASGRPGLYHHTQSLIAETPFTVTKSDPWRFHDWDQAPSTSVVKDADLKPLRFQPEAPQQMIYYAARRTPVPAEAAEKPQDSKGEVKLVWTPELDWRAWGQKSETLWRPEVAEPGGASVLVARITGGPGQVMGKYDWAEVTSIAWDPAEGAETVVIHAKVWRRAFIDGGKPARVNPEFAVPIDTRGLKGSPAEIGTRIGVRVVWSEGIDNPRGATEEIRH